LSELCQAMLELATTLKSSYQTWLDNVPLSLERLGACLAHSELLRGFFCRAKYSNLGATSTDPWSLLLCPLQRPRFYRWCCAELLRLTKSPPQREMLAQAHDILCNVDDACTRGRDIARLNNQRRSSPLDEETEVPRNILRSHRFMLVGRQTQWEEEDVSEDGEDKAEGTELMVLLNDTLAFLTPTTLVLHEVWEEAVCFGEAFVTRQRHQRSIPLHAISSVSLLAGTVHGCQYQGPLLELTLMTSLMDDVYESRGDFETSMMDRDSSLLLSSSNEDALRSWYRTLKEA